MFFQHFNGLWIHITYTVSLKKGYAQIWLSKCNAFMLLETYLIIFSALHEVFLCVPCWLTLSQNPFPFTQTLWYCILGFQNAFFLFSHFIWQSISGTISSCFHCSIEMFIIFQIAVSISWVFPHPPSSWRDVYVSLISRRRRMALLTVTAAVVLWKWK